MLLIDAYNVLHAQWCLPRERRGLDVRSLIDLIGASRYANRRVRVVCDGRPGREWSREGVLETGGGLAWTRVGHAEVVFSGPGREADDVIEDVLARSRGIAILLVSSDRRLIRAAKGARAEQVGNGTFLKQLAQDEREASRPERPRFATDVPLDGASVRSWMREFGFDPGGPRADSASKSTPEPAPKPRRHAPPKDSVSSFGDRLSIPDIPPPVEPPPEPMTDLTPAPPEDGYEHEPLDPLLGEAFEEWRGRLDPDDLDMNRWIDGVQPL